MRYAEEVDLLEEEMRRVLQFLEWRANWWRGRVGLRAEQQPEALREGHAAYAYKQAGYMAGLRTGFKEEWSSVAKLIEGARQRYAEMVADEGAIAGEEDEEGGDGEEGEENEDNDEEGAEPSGWLSD
jgi:ABC-type proline/glycine betaine transport system substrate-binding protein